MRAFSFAFKTNGQRRLNSLRVSSNQSQRQHLKVLTRSSCESNENVRSGEITSAVAMLNSNVNVTMAAILTDSSFTGFCVVFNRLATYPFE
jgi:hypothetical protein